MHTAETTAGHPLAGEKLLTLAEVAKRFPGRSGSGKSAHYTTIRRRVAKGTRSRFTGQLVKLEAFRDGDRWLTSEEALARYHAALNARPDDAPPANPVPPARGSRAYRAAERALDQMGV